MPDEGALRPGVYAVDLPVYRELDRRFCLPMKSLTGSLPSAAR